MSSLFEMSVETQTLSHDALYPRDALHRFRLYARRGDTLHVLAVAPNPGGIGQAIFTLDEDCRRAGHVDGIGVQGALGILDVLPDGHPSPTGRWLLKPWHRAPNPEGRRNP